MTPKQAAKFIGCTAHYIRALIRAGKLKARKVPTTNNQHGYCYIITVAEAERFKDAPVNRRGFPRGGKRK